MAQEKIREIEIMAIELCKLNRKRKKMNEKKRKNAIKQLQ